MNPPPPPRIALAALCVLLAPASLPPPSASGAEDDAALEAARERATRDIFVLRDYRAGKASFVESPERRPGAWTGVGYRHTLLDLRGRGSIRHLWTTRLEGEPPLDWEFFVDDEPAPGIRATDEQLVDAARRFPTPLAPANHAPVTRRDCNFFLPIPFDRSIRVDVVQRLPSFKLWFCQIDYRLDDASLAGARLAGREEGGRLTLEARGWPPEPAGPTAGGTRRSRARIGPVTIAPGEERSVHELAGPAIIRELRLAWSEGARLRLRASFDGARAAAIDSPVDRFFGPFRGASFYRHAERDSSCHLPMPFRERARLSIRNEGERPAELRGALAVERVDSFRPDWGYLHALHQRPASTDGHRPLQVLYVRGRGHWLGMTLYGTGHDHGGGDFAVIDGEGDAPAFLHGINGEDYFTFAWFGRGAHHPYAVAHSNDEGRYRHHFENPYPFRDSLAVEWGAYPGLRPESVAVWYQDSPEDTTLPDGARAGSVEWDVFGPVPIPRDAAGRWVDDPFAVLPRIEALDAGEKFECRLVRERFVAGWMKEWSVGPALNLTYIGRHGTRIVGEVELGGMGHALLARRFLESPAAGPREFLLANDDPCEVWVNGARIARAAGSPGGFATCRVTLPLRAGRNEIVVRLTNSFNRTFNWAGFLLR